MTSGTIKVHVLMLDNKVHSYDIKHKSDGIVLLQAVLKDLNLLEADYFGLLFKDNEENNVFLDTNKKLNIQIPNNASMELKFVVKFFPPDPSLLQEEYTRYLFALQIKQDINQGLLFCNDSTLATMASYIAQSEFGDWNSKDCSSLTYLKHMNILPDNYNEINIFSIISEHHKANMGQSQAEADFNLLNIARRLESYGLRLHSATSNDGNELKLSVNYSGVVIFRGTTKTNTFVWNQIRKLSFRKKRFLIKLKKEMNNDSFYSNSGDVVVLLMKSRDACKTFWRQCIEHHTFFRKDVRPEPKPQPLLLKRGSTFRYSGKTQKQLHELVSNSNFKRSAFIRTYNRTSCSSSRVTGNTWTSSQNGASDTVTSLQTRVQAKTELSKAASTVLPSSVENESASKIETKSTDEITVAGSWQEDSGNLHGGSDFVKQQSHRTQPDKRIDAEQPHKKQIQSDDSSVHLHSGGVSIPPMKISGISYSGTTSDAAETSQFALLSTSELKSAPASIETKKQIVPPQSFFIIKEILATERTFVKDLEVIAKWFKAALSEESDLLLSEVFELLFESTESLLLNHRSFLQQIEALFSNLEARRRFDFLFDHTIDNLMLDHIITLKKNPSVYEIGESLIVQLEKLAINEPKFESLYREFELQKVCYLPLSAFLLKPMQRVVHYQMLLESLLSQRSPTDSANLEKARNEVFTLAWATQERLQRAYNIQKMAQLRRDLIGVDYLFSSDNRSFIREGSLYKLSRKGFQQRLFFLFSDCLLYTTKGMTGTNQFKVHSELPLRGMIIEINEGDLPESNCFSVIVGNKTLIVATNNSEDMAKWLEDLNKAIASANKETPIYKSPMTNSKEDSVNRMSIGLSSEDGEGSVRNSVEGIKAPTQQRSNATMHVCWHRNTSVSYADHLLSLQNQLSGFLLRKFKNSNGWQKLWVVFSNFCLFFYKSHQDDFPLASLPLLGYFINSPTESDGIKKNFVFRLQFKTHVYFFRAESKYTFNRWVSVLSSANVTSQNFEKLTNNEEGLGDTLLTTPPQVVQ